MNIAADDREGLRKFLDLALRTVAANRGREGEALLIFADSAGYSAKALIHSYDAATDPAQRDAIHAQHEDYANAEDALRALGNLFGPRPEREAATAGRVMRLPETRPRRELG